MGQARVRCDLGLRIAVVDPRFEYLHFLSSDLCTTDPANKLLGLARKHRAHDHFDPAGPVQPVLAAFFSIVEREFFNHILGVYSVGGTPIIGKKRDREKGGKRNLFQQHLKHKACEIGRDKALPKMQTSVSCGQGVLSQLPGALYVEPGKLRQSRMPDAHHPSAFLFGPVLVVYAFRRVVSLKEIVLQDP